MARYKITIEYDGSPFLGWQKQPEGPSIQGALEDAIFKMSGDKVKVMGSGRTDAGVHALGQVAHFDLKDDFPKENIIGGLNYHLKPNPVCILDATLVADDFHARYSAKNRVYEYKIIIRNTPLALDNKGAWRIRDDLDIDKMQEAANFLIGSHDFSSFRSSSCQSKTPVKTISSITFRKEEGQVIMNIQAQSFLHNQVRIIIGNLHKVGIGQMDPIDIKKIRDLKDRTKSAETAPPYGLYLVRVDY